MAEAGNDVVQIELTSASTAGFAVAVGAEDALGHGLFIVVVLFAIDESMGDQLAAACTVVTGDSFLVTIEFDGAFRDQGGTGAWRGILSARLSRRVR